MFLRFRSRRLFTVIIGAAALHVGPLHAADNAAIGRDVVTGTVTWSLNGCQYTQQTEVTCRLTALSRGGDARMQMQSSVATARLTDTTGTEYKVRSGGYGRNEAGSTTLLDGVATPVTLRFPSVIAGTAMAARLAMRIGKEPVAWSNVPLEAMAGVPATTPLAAAAPAAAAPATAPAGEVSAETAPGETANEPAAGAASGPPMVLRESADAMLLLTLDARAAKGALLTGRFDFGREGCSGTLRQTGLSRTDQIVLSERLEKGRCVRGCSIVIEPDLVSYKEMCNGREGTTGRFSSAANAQEIRRRVAEQAAMAAERREAARLAAIEARKLPAPDLAPLTVAAKPTKLLKAEMSQIDDLGMVMVVTPDGKWVSAAEAEWVNRQPGSASQALEKLLKVGTNYVVFALHNKAFQFGPGRWTFQFELVGDAGSLWANAGGQAGGPVGIRYWKPLAVTKNAAGAMTVDVATAAQAETLRDTLSRFHDWLIKTYGVETSVANAVLSTVATSMLRDMGGGGGGGGANCDQKCQSDRAFMDNAARESDRREAQYRAEQEAGARAQQERLRNPNSLGW